MAEPVRPALFRHIPALADTLPWVSLGTFPTPLERVVLRPPGCGEMSVLVKRDDLSGSAYGGNKVRKLEFLLADAERRGAGRLITVGAAGSHHALATAVYGRARGLPVTLLLFPQPRTPHVQEVLLLDAATGAELRWTPRMAAIPLGILATRLRRWRDRPYMIPPGGSDEVGTLGYVNAGLELAEQLSAAGVERPVRIHLATGTMGTAVGLALGLALAGEAIPIHAVRITPSIVTNQRLLERLLRSTAARLVGAGMDRVPAAEALAMLRLRHEHVGEGYGKATEAGARAAEVFEAAGLVLDPTYTAKAAAELLAEPTDPAGPPPLFLHTLSAVEPADPAALELDSLPAPFRRYLAGAGAG